MKGKTALDLHSTVPWLQPGIDFLATGMAYLGVIESREKQANAKTENLVETAPTEQI
jgi:hypothetical protein